MDCSHQALCCPLSPGVCSDSHPLNWWCYLTISSSAAPFSSCPQSFQASEPFPMTRFFPSGNQRTGASTSVLPMNTQGWFPSGLTGLISLQSQGLWRVFSNTTLQNHQWFSTQSSLWSNSHIHTRPQEKPKPWLYGHLLAKWCLRFSIYCLGVSQHFFQRASVF